ncbi:hypothetical protein VTN96DRAFT_7496 [Rasamsonia emersonii]
MPTRSSLKTNWAYAIRTDENPTEAGPPQERLMKKAYEYSVLCAADVFLAIIIRENGRVYTLCLDQAGILSHIQSQSSTYYLILVRTAPEDFEVTRQNKKCCIYAEPATESSPDTTADGKEI